MVKTFPASLEKLYEMLQFIKSAAETAGFENNLVSKIELASEEALVNIISHGYPEKKDGYIDISCLILDEKGIKIIIRDTGIAFNPLDLIKDFHPNTPIIKEQQDQLGGYGIYFIIKMMDKVEYQRIDNANILHLTKLFSPAIAVD